ncbi:MAG TPA: hypothetical protein VFW42_00550 [Fluviicoccus sp.]|nr:hypothetical protein [Fluviicoccus sp.]
MKHVKALGYGLAVTAALLGSAGLLWSLSTTDPESPAFAARTEGNAGPANGPSGNDIKPPVASGGPGHHEDVPAAMRAQLADIAEAYAVNARFPDYSRPLQANDWNLLHPRAFIPRRSPVASVPGLSASLVLDRYILDRNADQPVKVVLAGNPGTREGVSLSAANVWLQQNGRRSAMTALADNGQAFSGVINAAVLRSLPPGETAVMAQLELSNGQRTNVSAMIRLYEPQARLVRLGESRVEGADLVIPANFEVRSPGHYLVAANLFTADGREPVSHLNAELALSPANPAGLLKVHAVTLRTKGTEGPYLLKDFDITRLPDAPGDATGFGSTALETATVRGFPLDSYSPEPYEDPAAAEKLAFLQKMAAGK